MRKSLIDLLEAYPINEPENPLAQIYCDLDGVLTDFDGRFQHYAGMSPKAYEAKYGTGPFWNLIDREIGIEFWSGMGWMQGGEELWNYIKYYNPIILSSPSKDPLSRKGKTLWVEKNLHPSPKIIFKFSENKRRHAKDHILIDDKRSNIEDWKEDGGIALRCLRGNIEPVLTELQKLGY